ncbi:MAG: hypothetical protein P8H97_04135 [Pseudomonadales bacterium]|nr:hypothetical protein [Pseudomonadales bacterium]
MIVKILHKAMFALVTCFIISGASAFEWKISDLWVCGDAPFTSCDDFPALDPIYDDFEDGDRAAAPTGLLLDYPGSNVLESGGYLIFDGDDGGIEIDLGDGSTPYVRDEVYVDILVPDNTGDGYTAFSAQFDADLSQLAVGGVDDTSSGFGITFAGLLNSSAQGGLGAQGAQLGVFNSIFGCPTIFFNDLNPYYINLGLSNYGYDVIGGGSGCTTKQITGDIVLRLTLWQDTLPNPALSANNYLIPSYSIDGGATFIEYANWDSFVTGGFAGPYYIPISYDSAVATAFGQTAVNQLLIEESVPLPMWAMGMMAGTLMLITAKIVRRRR